MLSVVDRNVVVRRIPVILRLWYQLSNSPFYAVFCIYLFLSTSAPFPSNTHNKKFTLTNTPAAAAVLSTLHQCIEPPRSRSLHVLPSSNTQDGYLNIPTRAPSNTGGGSVPRIGEAVRPPVSMTTADGDCHTATTLGASPYLSFRLVHQAEFLVLAVDIASSVIGLPLVAIIHKRSDLAAGIEIRLRNSGSRVQLPERQKIYLFPTTARPPLDPPSLLFAF